MLEWYSKENLSLSGRAVGLLNTTASQGFTLGDILDGIMAASNLHITTYFDGKTTKWSLSGTMEHVKRDKGAMLKALHIDMKDVVVPSKEERDAVTDL